MMPVFQWLRRCSFGSELKIMVVRSFDGGCGCCVLSIGGIEWYLDVCEVSSCFRAKKRLGLERQV